MSVRRGTDIGDIQTAVAVPYFHITRSAMHEIATMWAINKQLILKIILKI